MNAVTADTRQNGILAMLKNHPVQTFFGALLLGLGALIASTGPHYRPMIAPEPITFTMWQTPQVQVVAREEPIVFGAPYTVVSMDEFKIHAANAPYVASYWAGWQKNKMADGADEEVEPWQIYYLVKKPGTDVYLIASEEIPFTCAEFYRCRTTFDAGANSFTTSAQEIEGAKEARERHDLLLSWFFTALIAGIGLALLFFAFVGRDEKWEW